MTLLHWPSHVPKKNAALVVHAVMHVQVSAPQAIAEAAHVVPLAPTQHLPTAATSLPAQVVMPNPPLSAYAQSPRQLQQLTVNKE
jgi:predicted secreted protein